MPVITLGSRSFAGPFMAPLWSPPKAAAVYAVMAPGWRLLTFRALEFDHAADLSARDFLRRHPKYGEWLSIVGTEWNLYVATCEMPSSTDAERAAAVRELARGYRPEFQALSSPEECSLRALQLAQARTNKDN
jgi:hypothetical protein